MGTVFDIDGSVVVVESCGNVLGIDRAVTHDVLWTTATTDPGTYVTAVRAVGTTVVAWGSDRVLAYSVATGTRLWQQLAPSGSSVVAAAADSTRVAVGFSDRIRVFNLATGVQVWQRLNAPSREPIIDGGFVYLVSDGALRKISLATGVDAWATADPDLVNVRGVDGDTVYVYWGQFDFGSDTVSLRAFSSTTGALQFELFTPSRTRSLAITNDLLIVLWTDEGIYGNDTSGITVYRKSDRAELWSTDEPSKTFTTSNLALANGHLVAVLGKNLRVFGLAPPLPTITDTILPSAHVSQPFSYALQGAGGALPLRWTIVSGSFGAGLSLAQDGTISGTPTAAGLGRARVRVTDARGRSAERDLVVETFVAAAVDWDTGGRTGARNGVVADPAIGVDTVPSLSQRWKTAPLANVPNSDQGRAPIVVGDRLIHTGIDGIVRAWSTTGTGTADRSAGWSATADAPATFVWTRPKNGSAATSGLSRSRIIRARGPWTARTP